MDITKSNSYEGNSGICPSIEPNHGHTLILVPKTKTEPAYATCSCGQWVIGRRYDRLVRRNHADHVASHLKHGRPIPRVTVAGPPGCEDRPWWYPADPEMTATLRRQREAHKAQIAASERRMKELQATDREQERTRHGHLTHAATS